MMMEKIKIKRKNNKIFNRLANPDFLKVIFGEHLFPQISGCGKKMGLSFPLRFLGTDGFRPKGMIVW